MGFRDLLALIAKLRELVDKFGISFKELYELIAPLFTLPDLVDSESTRNWVRSLIAVLDKGVDLSDTELDDKAVATLSAVVNNDAAWSAFHGLLVGLLNLDKVGAERSDDVPTVDDSTKAKAEEVVKALADASEPQTVAADKPAIGILTIISIAGFVLKAFKFFRDRRNK